MWGWRNFYEKEKIKFLWSIIFKNSSYGLYSLVSMKRPYILYWIVFVPLSKNSVEHACVYLVLGSLFCFINLYVSLSLPTTTVDYYNYLIRLEIEYDWFIPLYSFLKIILALSVPLSFHVTCKMILPISSKILLRYYW